jgi:hypothetical protein
VLLGIDLLIHLRQQAMSPSDLAGPVEDVQRILDLLEREGLVSGAGAGYPSTNTRPTFGVGLEGHRLVEQKRGGRAPQASRGVRQFP